MTAFCKPGETAPATTTYVLVNQSGASLDVAIRIDKGDRLPPITVGAAYGPYWYVQLDDR